MFSNSGYAKIEFAYRGKPESGISRSPRAKNLNRMVHSVVEFYMRTRSFILPLAAAASALALLATSAEAADRKKNRRDRDDYGYYQRDRGDDRRARVVRSGRAVRPARFDRPARFNGPARFDRPARFNRPARFYRPASVFINRPAFIDRLAFIDRPDFIQVLWSGLELDYRGLDLDSAFDRGAIGRTGSIGPTLLGYSAAIA